MHFKYTSRLNSDQHNRAAFTGYVLSWVWNNESYGWWDYVEFRNEAGERGEWRRKGRSKVGKDKELIWSKGLWSYWEELPACYSAKVGPNTARDPGKPLWVAYCSKHSLHSSHTNACYTPLCFLAWGKHLWLGNDWVWRAEHFKGAHTGSPAMTSHYQMGVFKSAYILNTNW